MYALLFETSTTQQITIKSKPNKTEYKVGEELDLTGAKITVTREKGITQDLDVTSSMFSGNDKNKEGEQTVTYEGKTATFTVNVLSNNGLGTGAIIGIVCGSVAFLGLIACAVIIILRKKKDKNEK